jgi:glycolate oxidase
MMDRITLRCVEDYIRADLPTDCEAMLLVDVDGEAATIDPQVQIVARVFGNAGAAMVRAAASPAETQSLWRARRSTSSSFGRLRPNKLGEDISVPRAEIPSMVRATQQIGERYDLLIPIFGHIGDGNLHPNILCDLRDTDEMARVGQAARAIFVAAIERGGVLSGEHGIGLLKRDFLSAGLDPTALALMTRIKNAFDPEALLNPGKIAAG